MIRQRSCKKRQSGVGMIEVLVAVLVMSIGFLAVAQMQIRGMRYNQSTYLRSQAAMMLKDMTDRMRSNRVGVKNGSYNAMTTANDKALPDCVTNAIPCTPAELAAKDIYEWSMNIHPPAAQTNAIPTFPAANAVGKVTQSAGVYDVSIEWTEIIDGTSENQSMTVQFMP
ncbi:MAG: type IV pilus modification protein PilV [Granulosicoccus sp.]|nr:type IV pilus modification protein PilV [Granulosicoccus sp.]